jgi:hypothetical protein
MPPGETILADGITARAVVPVTLTHCEPTHRISRFIRKYRRHHPTGCDGKHNKKLYRV